MFSLVIRNKVRLIIIFVVMTVLLMATTICAVLASEPKYWTWGAPAGAILAVLIGFYVYCTGADDLLGELDAQQAIAKDEPVLVNIVQEMVIASGLGTCPTIYIIENDSYAAFSTGTSHSNAAIVVTRGLLRGLSRDELQAVVAHEISHIYHQDIFLMLILATMTSSIGVISDVQMASSANTNKKSAIEDGAKSFMVSAVLRLFIYLFAGYAAKKLIMMASHAREYMADASSAVYTRNPEALASALEKMHGDCAVGDRAKLVTVAAMLTTSDGKNIDHPPLDVRIAILRRLAGTPSVSYLDYASTYEAVTGQKARFMPSRM